MKFGSLTLFIGPMFSGKTTRLCREVSKIADIGIKCLIINSAKDNRHNLRRLGSCTTHNNDASISPHIDCTSTNDLGSIDVSQYTCIGVDEGQFYDSLDAIKTWVVEHNKIVFVSGLDGDIQQKKFGKILDLIPLCDRCDKLTAYCKKCAQQGKLVDAPFTRKFIVNNVDTMDNNNSNDIVDVAGSDKYEAVCRRHI